MDFSHIADLIPVPGSQAALVGAGILEFLLRAIPSEKPLSILHLVGYVAKGAGNILVKVGNLLDAVLPQNIKAPEGQAK